MKVTVWKNEKESNERCITRFNKMVQASRKILKVRTSRYHKRKPTRRIVRDGAVMRDHYRAIRQKRAFH